jgi:hypothetical protein
LPNPLRAIAVTAADIDTTRGTDDKGWKYEFKDALSEVPYPILATVHDKENIYAAGVTLTNLKPLMVVATLVNDAAFAIQVYDFITITINNGRSEEDVIVRLPANTGTAPSTYYIDEDGNTYTDQALTTPACGSVVASDTLTLSDALGVTEFDVPFSDTLTFENDDITLAVINLTIYAEDKLFFSELLSSIRVESLILYMDDILSLSDYFDRPFETTSLIVYASDIITLSEVLSSMSVESLIIYMYDNLFFEESIKESLGGWEEIASGTSSWVEV